MSKPRNKKIFTFFFIKRFCILFIVKVENGRDFQGRNNNDKYRPTLRKCSTHRRRVGFFKDMILNNYNPDLGINLDDLRMLEILQAGDDCGLDLVSDVLMCVEISIRCKTTFTFPYRPKQIAYDILMERALPKVKAYEDYLVEIGYTREEIDDYHSKQAAIEDERDAE